VSSRGIRRGRLHGAAGHAHAVQQLGKRGEIGLLLRFIPVFGMHGQH